MADCTVNNQILKNAVESINNAGKNLATAGDNFVTAFTNAINGMSGEAYDELSAFFKQSYEPLVSGEGGIGEMVKGLGNLLETNRVQFAQVDHNIAEQIREARK